jgi:hypothetical protein
MRVPQFPHFVEATRMSSSIFGVIDAAPEAMLVVDGAGVLVMMGVAKGIERQEQLDALRDIGLHIGQGYLSSPAVSTTEGDVLISRTGLWPRRDQKVSTE